MLIFNDDKLINSGDQNNRFLKENEEIEAEIQRLRKQIDKLTKKEIPDLDLPGLEAALEDASDRKPRRNSKPRRAAESDKDKPKRAPEEKVLEKKTPAQKAGKAPERATEKPQAKERKRSRRDDNDRNHRPTVGFGDHLPDFMR